MKISEKKLENATVELEIEIPSEEVEAEYAVVFGKIQKKAKVDGFRLGKAPISLVEQKYADSADKDVIENLIKKTYMNAVKEKDLHPISEPRFELKEFARGKVFVYKTIVELPPELELGNYKNIEAEERACEISDDDINFEIDALREKYAVVSKKEDGVKVSSGDLVVLKLKRIDNIKEEEIESTEFKDFTIVAGKSRDEYAVDKHIYGMKAGDEKEIEIKYPKDYIVKDLANQKVRYIVKISEISEMTLPEVNDEFAVRENYLSADDMKGKQRERLEKYVKDKIQAEVRSSIIKKIIDDSKFQIPESLVVNEMGSIFARTQERVGMKAENLDDFCAKLGIDKEEFSAKIRLDAEAAIKSTLVLAEVAKKEDMKISDERYKGAIDDVAKRNNKSFEEIESVMKQFTTKERFESDLLLEDAMKFIYDNSKIKKQKSVSFDQFLRG